jgi:thiol:disulfide interchange protein DsbD
MSPAEIDLFSREVSRGPLYAAVAAFVGGLLVCLTPCVYPMIAITVSVFGAKKARSRFEAISLSSAFVLGVAAMFTPLGVAAAFTGSLFGSALSNPWVVGFISLVFLALSASMLGAFELVLPAGVGNRLAQVGGSGLGGAFLLGLVSGLIAAPCTGPVLTGILLWIGKTRSVALGASALFAFSLGLGLPFWVVGAFAVHLPKSGPWMVRVKVLFGIVLAVAALYFLKNAVPALAWLARPGTATLVGYVAIAFAGAALALGAREATPGAASAGRVALVTKWSGVVLAVAGSFLAIASSQIRTADLSWEASEQRGRERALAEHRPLLIDFTAAWCAACNEIARLTFSNPDVKQEASRFIAVQVDATHEDDPNVDTAKDRYRVVGLPTVVLIGSDGRERTRFTEFVAAPEMLKALQQVD